jgi:hypothetical protein
VLNRRVLLPLIALALLPRLATAGSAADKHLQFMRSLDSMMVELAPQTARSSAIVRREYRDYLDLLVLNEYAALEDALYTGGLVPLPADTERFNLKVRTEGAAPIAEKDLDNQSTYIAARPATVGALVEIASRVTSGPIEITSLVRHTDYQDELRSTNSNANTSIPMHTMGLAVDIALVNTPLSRVYEIRDVLNKMQADGDILVIGERKQLVFHVVPHPSRLGYFTDVYARTVASPPTAGTEIASTPLGSALSPLAQAVVETNVIQIGPTDDHADEWWAAGGIRSDLTVEVTGATQMRRDDRSFVSRFAARCLALVAGVVQSAREFLIA